MRRLGQSLCVVAVCCLAIGLIGQSGSTAEGGRSPQFIDEAGLIGLTFRHVSPLTAERHIHLTMGSGAAWCDYDRDGRPDLYLGQGTPWTGRVVPEDGPSDELFRQVHGRFRAAAGPAGLRNTVYATGVGVGDVDNDGFPDLYVANFGPSRFFHNNGDGTFSEESQAVGLADEGYGASCTWFDADGDGLLDLFVVHYVEIDPQAYKTCTEPSTSGEPLAIACPPWSYVGEPDRLWLNQGDGRFADASDESGLHAVEPAQGLGVVAADLDGDGDQDLYVSNDSVPNHHWRNDGRGRFTEVGLLTGTSLNGDGLREAGMGIAIGDGDGDGGVDLFVTNFQEESNTFYRHEFEDQFSDVTDALGLGAPSRNRLGFGTNFLDAENDGDLDLFIANGHLHDRLRELGRPEDYEQTPQLMVFDRGRFSDASAQSGPPFETPGLGRGSAVADFDRDGRVDIAVNHLDGPASLLRNETEDAGRYLLVQLIGVRAPRDAIGSRIAARLGERTLVRLREGSTSYLSCSDGVVHLGVGDSEMIDELEVVWPGGRRQQWRNLPTKQLVVLIEGEPHALAGVH